jgi:hypothetical protein
MPNTDDPLKKQWGSEEYSDQDQNGESESESTESDDQ